jgi:hypothetical protein
MKLTRKSRLFLLLSTLLVLSPGYKLLSQAGGAAVPFLLISPDARSSGMGEVGTAIADDVNAVYWNPAGYAFHDFVDNGVEEVPYRQVAISGSKWLPQFNADLYYINASFAHYVEDIDGTLAANIVFMNLGEFTRTLEGGQSRGKFFSNEFAIAVSYGAFIAEDLGVGAVLRYIRSNLAPATTAQDAAGVGESFSFDLGFLWKPSHLEVLDVDLSNRFSLGLNLQNIGPKMTYRKESDPLPTTLRLGAAVTLVRDEFNDLKIATDISKLLIKRDSLGSDPLPKSLVTGWENSGVEFSIGAEYWYQQIIALRAGYFMEPSVLGNRKYWNFGAGIRYSVLELDFSFINTVEENHPLANTMRFSLIFDWK